MSAAKVRKDNPLKVTIVCSNCEGTVGHRLETVVETSLREESERRLRGYSAHTQSEIRAWGNPWDKKGKHESPDDCIKHLAQSFKQAIAAVKAERELERELTKLNDEADDLLKKVNDEADSLLKKVKKRRWF